MSKPKERYFYFKQKITERLTADSIHALWPENAQCLTHGCHKPVVVFHWFNQRHGKPVSRGTDWFYCEKHDKADPFGKKNGSDEKGIKIYRFLLPKTINLQVEV